MTDENKVVEFPRETPPALLVGPFQYYQVIVQGRAVPGLTGYKRDDGTVALTVDGRFGADFPSEEVAASAAWLIAQAAAVAAGYSHLEADNKDRPFAPRSVQLAGVSE